MEKVVKKKAARKKGSALRKTAGRKVGRKIARKKAARRMLPKNTALADEVSPQVEFSSDYCTAQIYSMGFEFAFAAYDAVKKLYKQACTFVYCKDFLHDAVWAHVNKTKWQIYGYKYNSKTDVPLDDDNCVFLFRNTDFKKSPEKLHDNLAACQQFLNGIEKKLGFEPSQLFKIPHDAAPCWLVVGDKGWQHAAPMLGLYTLFIRVGVYHKLGDTADATLARALKGEIKIGANSGYAGNLDSGYIEQSQKGIETILKHGLDVFHPTIEANYPTTLQNFGLHDNFGPVNFTRASKNNGAAKKAMPFWYRKEIWG